MIYCSPEVEPLPFSFQLKTFSDEKKKVAWKNDKVFMENNC
jgi:hypothetical protein